MRKKKKKAFGSTSTLELGGRGVAKARHIIYEGHWWEGQRTSFRVPKCGPTASCLHIQPDPKGYTD